MSPEAIAALKDAMLKHFDDDKDSFGVLRDGIADIAEALRVSKIDREKSHAVLLGQYQEMKIAIADISSKSEPVNEWFKNINYSKKVFIWILGVVGSIVAIVLGIVEIFRSQ